MQQPGWYLRRLRRMSGAEVAYRVARRVRKVSEHFVSMDVLPRDAYATDLRFLPPFWSALGRPFHRFVTTGFLPQRFRDEMRLPWTAADQRRFDALLAALGRVVRVLPGPLRRFPFNLCLWDLRRRLRTGRPLV